MCEEGRRSWLLQLIEEEFKANCSEAHKAIAANFESTEGWPIALIKP